ncbi:MAG: hypothetical protein ABIQ31_05565 [Ferruginibacter sp.]
MYGLPNNIDLNFLIQRQLLQICFGENEMIMNFDDNLSITLTSKCAFSFDGDNLQIIENYSTSASLICNLIGHFINEIKASENGTLAMNFSGNNIFILYDDDKFYESYWIKSKTSIIVV